MTNAVKIVDELDLNPDFQDRQFPEGFPLGLRPMMDFDGPAVMTTVGANPSEAASLRSRLACA